jgi:hypothetical protein
MSYLSILLEVLFYEYSPLISNIYSCNKTDRFNYLNLFLLLNFLVLISLSIVTTLYVIENQTKTEEEQV